MKTRKLRCLLDPGLRRLKDDFAFNTVILGIDDLFISKMPCSGIDAGILLQTEYRRPLLFALLLNLGCLLVVFVDIAWIVFTCIFAILALTDLGDIMLSFV